MWLAIAHVREHYPEAKQMGVMSTPPEGKGNVKPEHSPYNFYENLGLEKIADPDEDGEIMLAIDLYVADVQTSWPIAKATCIGSNPRLRTICGTLSNALARVHYDNVNTIPISVTMAPLVCPMYPRGSPKRV